MSVQKFQQKKYVTIKEASKWASNYLNREVSVSNISYLIQYGQLNKYNNDNVTKIDLGELEKYYYKSLKKRRIEWDEELGTELNWGLSFDHLREKDTTKHVHRLHPYKGKFIPQLVQYFIDNHIDNFKKENFFKPGDILLDPFAGSGTTLVQANELGLHSIGIDISTFNTMITEVKLNKYDFESLYKDIAYIKESLEHFEINNNIQEFELVLLEKLYEFNKKYFPNPKFKQQLKERDIDEKTYGKEKEKEFLNNFYELVKKYNIKLEQENTTNFLDKWFCYNVRKEIEFVYQKIKEIKNKCNQKALEVILSRTIRSCRATKHYNLATLKEPQLTTYYCFKHKKICKPLFTIKNWFNKYAEDTVSRLYEFNNLRTSVNFSIISKDARSVDIFQEVKKNNAKLFDKLRQKKIRGIFTSPPYVGQIDYHDQHAYAYELLGYDRKDKLEIGPLFKGKGKQACRDYKNGISDVLINCRKFLDDDYNIFLVANDKYNLYPDIVDRAGMQIVNRFKRPVLNRTERDNSPYSETIFHIKNK